MNSNSSHGFTGYGHVRAGIWTPGAVAAYKDVGSAQSFDVQPQIQVERIPNMASVAGGDYDTDNRADQVTVNIKLDSYSPANLALATGGKVNSVDSTPVANEPAVAHVGAYVPFAKLADISQPITVKDSTGTTTFVAGVDYVADSGGISIPAAGGAMTEGEGLKFSYTALAQDKVEALVNPNQVVSLLLVGQNRMAGGTPSRVQVHKVKLALDSAVPFITQKPGQISLKGSVLLDSSIVFDPAAPLSQFFTIENA